jgi:cytochrome c2
MRHYKKLLFFTFSILIWSCQQKIKSEKISNTSSENSTLTKANDSLTIDLVALQKQGKLPPTTAITVIDDPVYHGVKHYNAFSLQELLNSYPKIKGLDAASYQIVFECEDGYKPVMPLGQFLSKKAFIAISDIDAPKGQLWSKIIKDGHEMKAAPFYLVYKDVSSKETDYKWPYNLTKIHFVTNFKYDSLLFPKEDNKVVIGFQLFKKNCIICHSINKIGGKMGPELNYPKSVTEYWKNDQLKAFIKNPASFRNNVKMPTLNLKEKEIEEITNYLTYMSNHKL